MAEDPFILNKVVASWSIRPWRELFDRRGTDAGMTARPSPGSVFMVFHYPEPGHAEALAEGMSEMGAHLTGQPGLIEVDPPWWDEQHQALVGISRWASEAAFRAVVRVRPVPPFPLVSASLASGSTSLPHHWLSSRTRTSTD